MTQYIITAIILAACIAYAAFCIFKTYKKAIKCKDYHCAGCAFYEKCKSQKKSRFGAHKK